MSHHQLDARRLLCPMPVIRTQNKVKTLALGDTLEVWATDPGVRADIPAWCRICGHEVIKTEQQDDVVIIHLRVGRRVQ